MADDKPVPPPSPFVLAAPMLGGGMMIGLLLGDLGVCLRAAGGEQQDTQLAENYFQYHFKARAVALIAPAAIAIALLAAYEDLAPVCRGSRQEHHWAGVFVVAGAIAVAVATGAALQPRLAQAEEHFFDAEDGSELAKRFGAVIALILVLLAALALRTYQQASASGRPR